MLLGRTNQSVTLPSKILVFKFTFINKNKKQKNGKKLEDVAPLVTYYLSGDLNPFQNPPLHQTQKLSFHQLGPLGRVGQ